ncbi:hypothetical protein GCM10010156_74140 [Planobispora rosea]|uniref:hypothetical protein n=1 Tax=Planobispora rosea TaxID=35762 RepID=UPI00166F9FA2|nr:hypothetical protein [Planobispora rosea]GGT05577.1 hypothetical protein GCM10010156_74140 [Planobispora rosea]
MRADIGCGWDKTGRFMPAWLVCALGQVLGAVVFFTLPGGTGQAALMVVLNGLGGVLGAV